MSRYRWLRPMKCLETMAHFPSVSGQSDNEMERLLFEAVSRGDIRGILNDEVVPKAHVGIYLGLYVRASSEQQPHTLPPDLSLNYDDLCAVFDRPVVDARTRGRPRQEHSGWTEDRRLASDMHRMLAGHPSMRQATSATEAARILVDSGQVKGVGTDESRVKRLVRTFRKYYST